MADEAPHAKRRRFSLSPDLEVEVGGETVEACSRVLMAASPVFARMLESEMVESQSGRIVLAGKTIADFQLVLRHLDLRAGAAAPEVTRESVEPLLRWADEYQIDGLKTRCENFLSQPPTCLGIFAFDFYVDLACKYRLENAQKRLAHWASGDIKCFRDIISKHVHDAPFMRVIISQLNLTFGLASTSQVDDSQSSLSHAEMLWRIVMKALDMSEKPSQHGFPCKGDKEYYQQRAESLRRSILDAVPSLIGKGSGKAMCWIYRDLKESDFAKMTSTDVVVAKCQPTFVAEETQTMLDRMIAQHEVLRTDATGKLYRF